MLHLRYPWTPFEFSNILINTYQLVIVASLYPQPLLSHLLIPTHIIAIEIRIQHTCPSFSMEQITEVTIANNTIKLICLVRAYGKYYNNLSTALPRERTIHDNYRMLGWEFIDGIDILSLNNLPRTGSLWRDWRSMERNRIKRCWRPAGELTMNYQGTRSLSWDCFFAKRRMMTKKW